MAEVSGSRLVSTDEGLTTSVRNKIDELGNVFAMIAIAHAHGQVFVHGLADGKNLRGFRIDTDDTEGSRFGQARPQPTAGLARGLRRDSSLRRLACAWAQSFGLRCQILCLSRDRAQDLSKGDWHRRLPHRRHDPRQCRRLIHEWLR